MSPAIYILTVSLPLLAAIIVFAMKYASSYAAAKARLAELAEFRALTEAQGALIAAMAASLKAMEADMARQSAAIAKVDTLLSQVD